ncbi:MAG TPA: hypothetical protein VK540_26105 [Polyangiaceae bacterium]|jgi:hypothetical protein|nr:hypothetical protein [Polyangiaceae bacterium]
MVQPIQPYAAFDASSVAIFREHLTPDALMTYLSTRLDGLDTQVNAVFNRQQHTQAIQKGLTELRAALGQMKTTGDDQKDGVMPSIEVALKTLTDLDPNLGETLRNQLGQDGYALWGDSKCNDTEMKQTMSYLDGVGKDIDSSAQMDMIRLQSIMSARQTAIQLSTNLIASLSESTKSIVSNIGR